MRTTTCPICKGSGKLPDPHKLQVNHVEVNREMAVKLREKGFSIRQIMKALNYKSTHSITELFKEIQWKITSKHRSI